MVRAFLFDLDGTLVDDVYVHLDAWQAAFAGEGYPVERERIHALIGKTGKAIVEELAGHPSPEVSERILNRHIAYFRQQIPSLHPFSQSQALLAALHERGLKVALVTSSRKELAEAVGSSLAFRFDGLVTSENISKGKPDPEPFLRGLDVLGIAPKEAYAVGDSPFDARSAVAAGIRFLGVLSGGFSEEALKSAGAWRAYADVGGILSDLDALLDAKI